jgi:hypothetical protein
VASFAGIEEFGCQQSVKNQAQQSSCWKKSDGEDLQEFARRVAKSSGQVR